jgi:alcohol dehydrogenase (cytochrome c)
MMWTDSGVMSTASHLLFAGGLEGYFYAVDAGTGNLLWNATVAGQVAASPIAYQLDGKHHIAIAAGHSLFAYGLRD